MIEDDDINKTYFDKLFDAMIIECVLKIYNSYLDDIPSDLIVTEEMIDHVNIKSLSLDTKIKRCKNNGLHVDEVICNYFSNVLYDTIKKLTQHTVYDNDTIKLIKSVYVAECTLFEGDGLERIKNLACVNFTNDKFDHFRKTYRKMLEKILKPQILVEGPKLEALINECNIRCDKYCRVHGRRKY